jgi:hypothetical protein
MSLRLFIALQQRQRLQKPPRLTDEDFEIYRDPSLNITNEALHIERHTSKVAFGTYLSQLKISLLPIHHGESILGVIERLKWRNHCDATILDALVRKISKQTLGVWAIPNEYVGKIIFFPATVFGTEHGSKVAYLNGTRERARLRYLYPISDPINRSDAYIATLI